MSNISSVYVPDTGGFGGNNVESMLLGSMMGNGGGFGGGMNNPFWAIVLLAFLRNWGGFGGNGENNAQLSAIQDQLSTNHGQTLLMDAIRGNATSIKELASTIGCNHNAVQCAINGINAAINNVANANNMNSMQIVNAINGGNASIANQLSSCCCDLKTTINTQGYENRLANQQQSQLIQNGFCQIGFDAAQNANSIKQAIIDQTLTVTNKLDQQDKDRMQREINNLTADNATLRARAERQAELAPIYQQLNEIACKQPKTETVYAPSVVGIPACTAFNYGLYGGFPFSAQQGRGSIWS